MVNKTDKKSDKKRKLILSKAKQVFIRKGFAAVTMKDIIDECKISRGGIYLYFQSVDELFMQVIIMHNKQKLKETIDYIDSSKSFSQLLDEYFLKQKKRLLNIDKSLLIAMYEYRFSHKENYDKEFFYTQFINTKAIILEILNYGVSSGSISIKDLDCLAMNIVFFIEGISMLGTAAGVSEEFIDTQINFIKEMIFSHLS
ncbi:MAG: TetR/AcrR family transcriptional regulator [Clostridiales bacterium]|nr:TetR/AcrR family transcriptional regulator [Clostridiales bacterium]